MHLGLNTVNVSLIANAGLIQPPFKGPKGKDQVMKRNPSRCQLPAIESAYLVRNMGLLPFSAQGILPLPSYSSSRGFEATEGADVIIQSNKAC